MYDSHCPICMEIYLEPVVLPCDHCFCKPCFEEMLTKSTLQCALCRRRIGSWTRLQTRAGTLVDAERWSYIQKNYSAEVKARIEGHSTPKKQGRLNNSYPVSSGH